MKHNFIPLFICFIISNYRGKINNSSKNYNTWVVIEFYKTTSKKNLSSNKQNKVGFLEDAKNVLLESQKEYGKLWDAVDFRNFTGSL